MSLIDVLKSAKYTLIDVREPLELEMNGTIDGAKNIPFSELSDRKEEILSIKESSVVLFCHSGSRSSKALEYLTEEGLTNGYNGGGFAELKEKLDNL